MTRVLHAEPHDTGTKETLPNRADVGYDSVFSGRGGAWAFNEYVIYRPEQQRPRFLITLA